MTDVLPESSGFTPQQAAAIAAMGNVLVVAGAGTGKTRTLVERCVQHVLHKNVSLSEILMVTFTDAAAAEMRKRIRERLETAPEQDSANTRISEQLALLESASICTLHSFCLQLIRQHFYELEIDPQVTVLTEQQARVLQEETLDAIFAEAYAGTHPRANEICALIPLLDHRRDQKLRKLIQQLHQYTQTRPDPEAWFAGELARLEKPDAELWARWLMNAARELCHSWLPLFPADVCPQLRACAEELKKLEECDSRPKLAAILECIRRTDASDWKHGHKKHRKPLEGFFADAEFLRSVAIAGDVDPLLQDWQWSAEYLRTLLLLAQEFSTRFASAKRSIGAVDFHDLEQFSLRLLCTNEKPTPLAREWQQTVELIFVDEYQDINPAQDLILRALSRGSDGPGNRFLVGDVKQSIYGFRQAEPEIFLEYARQWKTVGSTFPLSENFRSHERLLDFINELFSTLMQRDLGEIDYSDGGQLEFGDRAGREQLTRQKDPAPRAELLLCINGEEQAEEEDLSNVEREASTVAQRLKELHDSGEAAWRDMVILLRAPKGKVEAYARQFDKAGVPLLATGGGLLEALEVQDLLNLLTLLDNPLQDRPLLAVLRSPLAGLSADDLVEIRLAARKVPFWTALERWHEAARRKEATQAFNKVNAFLERFRRWRSMSRCASLTQRLESVLEETNYLDWLATQNRAEQRRANIQQLLSLTREFDELHRENLHSFLELLDDEEEAGVDREPPPAAATDAVRLMSIHKSKGLEFPVVVLADLGKRFNSNETREEIILDGELGLCAKVHAPETGQTYPSLAFWLARKKHAIKSRAEELRLLYVAMTRAQQRLILSAACTEKCARQWSQRVHDYSQGFRLRRAVTCLDWLGPWFAAHSPASDWLDQPQGAAACWTWRIVGKCGVRSAECEVSETQDSAVRIPHSTLDLPTRLTWTYPYTPATTQAAKSSVTALRREAAEDPEVATPFVVPKFSLPAIADAELRGSDIGLAHHNFLQWVDLARVLDPGGLKEESARLVAANLLSAQQAAALELPAIARFWSSELGGLILQHKENVQRELPFTVRLTRDTDASIPLLSRIPEGEFIVVQGAIDLAVLLSKEIWIVDFKTDHVAGAALAEKAREYSVQLRLYALALCEIYRKPVTRCWLHFLHPGETREV